MNRNQAITHLRSQGFEVFERSWSLGNTIGVGAIPETHDGIRTFKALEYLYPVEGGRWGVTYSFGESIPPVFSSERERAARASVNLPCAH